MTKYPYSSRHGRSDRCDPYSSEWEVPDMTNAYENPAREGELAAMREMMARDEAKERGEEYRPEAGDMPSASALALLKALAAGEWKPLGDNPAFDGAAPDALCAEFEGAEFAAYLSELPEAPVLQLRRDQAPPYGGFLAIISGARLEIHGVDVDGDPVGFAFNWERGI